MGTPMITGIGDIYAKTKNLSANNFIFPFYPFNFELSADSSPIEAQGQAQGTLKTLASAKGPVSYTLTLSTQYIDFETLAFMLNERPDTDTTVDLYNTKTTATIPANSPYEIADAAITTSTDQSIFAYVSDSADGFQARTMILTGSVAAGQVLVNGTDGKLVFHSSDAGKTVTYYKPVTATNRRFVGGENTNTVGQFELWGTMEPLGVPVYFPSIDLSGEPTITMNGTDATELSISGTANVPVTLGYSKPYKIFEAA